MEILERDYPDADLRDVGIVAEVRTTEDEGEMIRTPTYCTNDSRVYQTGLWDWASGVAQDGEPGDEAEG